MQEKQHPGLWLSIMHLPVIMTIENHLSHGSTYWGSGEKQSHFQLTLLFIERTPGPEVGGELPEVRMQISNEVRVLLRSTECWLPEGRGAVGWVKKVKGLRSTHW